MQPSLKRPWHSFFASPLSVRVFSHVSSSSTYSGSSVGKSGRFIFFRSTHGLNFFRSDLSLCFDCSATLDVRSDTKPSRRNLPFIFRTIPATGCAISQMRGAHWTVKLHMHMYVSITCCTHACRQNVSLYQQLKIRCQKHLSAAYNTAKAKSHCGT